MEKKQTAVDLIFEKFNLLSDADFKSWMFNNHDELKQMEKEEILDAWTDGYSSGMYQEGLGIDYYNETYLGIIKEEEQC